MLIRINCNLKRPSSAGAYHVIEDGLTPTEIDNYVRQQVLQNIAFDWEVNFTIDANIEGVDEEPIHPNLDDVYDEIDTAVRDAAMSKLMSKVTYSWERVDLQQTQHLHIGIRA